METLIYPNGNKQMPTHSNETRRMLSLQQLTKLPEGNC